MIISDDNTSVYWFYLTSFSCFMNLLFSQRPVLYRGRTRGSRIVSGLHYDWLSNFKGQSPSLEAVSNSGPWENLLFPETERLFLHRPFLSSLQVFRCDVIQKVLEYCYHMFWIVLGHGEWNQLYSALYGVYTEVLHDLTAVLKERERKLPNGKQPRPQLLHLRPSTNSVSKEEESENLQTKSTK
jgi:hypothetical protein